MKIATISVICCMIFACSSPKQGGANSTEELCYSFDQRQCATDDYAKLITDFTQENLFKGMSQYLASQDIDLKHLRIDLNYHEMTCEACDVCPEHHRFFISIARDDHATLQRLNLLHLEKVSCDEFF